MTHPLPNTRPEQETNVVEAGLGDPEKDKGAAQDDQKPPMHPKKVMIVRFNASEAMRLQSSCGDKDGEAKQSSSEPEPPSSNSPEPIKPSYRRITRRPRRATTSQRSELAKSVLNEEFVLKKFDFRRFKCRTLNKHERAIFECEEEGCDLDVELHRHASAVSAVGEYLEMSKQSGESSDLPPPQGFLSAVQARCITKLYNDETKTRELMLGKVIKYSTESLLMIMARLSMKVVEYEAERISKIKAWSQVCKEHHNLSLDVPPVPVRARSTGANRRNATADDAKVKRNKR